MHLIECAWSGEEVSIRHLTFYLLSWSNNLVNASGGVTVAIPLTVFRIDIHS